MLSKTKETWARKGFLHDKENIKPQIAVYLKTEGFCCIF